MDNTYIIDDILEEQTLDNQEYDVPENKFYQKDDGFFCLTEEDFYPPADDRVWVSYVEDIEDGDNFADYCEYIFDLYEEESYWD